MVMRVFRLVIFCVFLCLFDVQFTVYPLGMYLYMMGFYKT